MNILIINFEYPPLGGGGGVATKQLAEELAKKHTVHVLTTQYKDLPFDEVLAGVHVHRVAVVGRKSMPTASLVSMVTFVPRALFRGIALCREQKFSIINAQFVIPSGIPAAILSFFYRVPLVVSFIGGDIYDPTKQISPHRHFWLRLLIRMIARQAAVCTAISEDTKKRAQDLHGVQKEIRVTHLGLKPLAISPASRADFDLPEDVPLAVTIGRLIPRKGYKILLKSWLLVPRAHLAIIGNGPLKPELEQFIKSTPLKNRVHLLGFVSEVRKLQVLRMADVYVSAAEHEGFGIVFLEAMHAGLPIVAVNDGGQRDFLEHEINALLVKPHHSKQLAEAVNTVLENKDIGKRMKLANQEKVKSFYLDQTTARFEKILQEVAKR